MLDWQARPMLYGAMTLTKWLSDKGASQAQFAKTIGVSQSVISRLCSSEPRWPNRELMQAIYIATNRKVTPMDFLYPNQGESP